MGNFEITWCRYTVNAETTKRASIVEQVLIIQPAREWEDLMMAVAPWWPAQSYCGASDDSDFLLASEALLAATS